jgi:hypothetical protein
MNQATKMVVAAALTLAAGGTLAASPVAAAIDRDSGRRAAGTVWAKVSANGNLLAGSGITAVRKFGGGRYNLDTSADIGRCALTGSLNSIGGSDPGPGSSSILVAEVNAHLLFVRTATPSSSGNAVVDDDRPFSVLIVC